MVSCRLLGKFPNVQGAATYRMDIARAMTAAEAASELTRTSPLGHDRARTLLDRHASHTLPTSPERHGSSKNVRRFRPGGPTPNRYDHAAHEPPNLRQRGLFGDHQP